MSMFDFMSDIDDYETRKVGRIERENNNGIGVSTAYTTDEGYETALFDKNGTHPVERYDSKRDAESGHEKWIQFAGKADNQKVTKLGGLGLIKDREIILTDITIN